MMKPGLMPTILYCSATECAYNEHEKCHAGAITVDGPGEPMCDTFFKSNRKGGIEAEGAVGACKNGACVHNNSFECAAGGIHVSMHQQIPECDTFVPAKGGENGN